MQIGVIKFIIIQWHFYRSTKKRTKKNRKKKHIGGKASKGEREMKKNKKENAKKKGKTKERKQGDLIHLQRENDKIGTKDHPSEKEQSIDDRTLAKHDKNFLQ